jgi:hypothetical protein
MLMDSFSGPASDLKKSQRTMENLLATLAKHPRVSTWDMDENGGWLWRFLRDAEQRGLLTQDKREGFPWLRYELTDAGRAFLEPASTDPK